VRLGHGFHGEAGDQGVVAQAGKGLGVAAAGAVAGNQCRPG
jgi:hypothetical protein